MHLEKEANELIDFLMNQYEKFEYKLKIDFNYYKFERFGENVTDGVSGYWNGKQKDLFKTIFGIYRELAKNLPF
jgi:DNA polymerase II small subunit/DNA polymerase delta subunit B